jgi:tetratricopeptide (TPR) repeat protein
VNEVDRARVFRLFDEALAQAGDARPAFLSRACDGDEALRTAVEELLRAEERSGPSTASLENLLSPFVPSAAGRTFGRFRVLELIGRGGMGSVYRAERTDGLDQKVALKLLRADVLGRASRIERETRTLARLQHPAIAQFIDAGVEADGTAWIAMELIGGAPIDAFCEAGSVPLRERVRLLAEVTDAVSFAHRNFVVHRDIKPGNVLMTAEGKPKLIDFGIAKLLDGSGAGLATREGGSLFTPQYAAPEQFAGGAISVATDVFGLGALGYRLLTGSTIFSDAPTPLGYLVALTQRDVPQASRAAEQRGALAAAKALRGDLDSILAKALEREPEKRYASAGEMAADLARYLEHRPVVARAQTAAYRAGRFIRRNALAVSLWGLLLVSLVAGSIVSAVQARRATVARDEARAVIAFLSNDILAAANPMVSGTRDVQLRPLLDNAAGSLETRFAGQPRVLAGIQAALGTGYAALFDAAKAEALLTAAERGLSQEYGDSAAETQSVRLTLWYLYLGRVALPKLGAVSMRMSRAEVAAGRPDSPNAMRGRLVLEMAPCNRSSPLPLGWSDCGKIVSNFYDAARKKFGDDALITNEMGWLTGVALVYASREDEAVPFLRTACSGMERTYGPVHHRLTACRRFLAWALDGSGDPAAAEPIFQQAIQNFSTTLGPDSIFTAISEYEEAAAALHAGHLPQALAVARAAVQSLSRPGCDCDDDLAKTRMRLALIEVTAGETEAGLQLARKEFEQAVAVSGAGAPGVVGLRSAYAHILSLAGKGPEALAAAEENLAIARTIEGRPAWLEAELQAEQAYVLAFQHRGSEAKALLQVAAPTLERVLGASNARTRRAAAARAELSL